MARAGPLFAVAVVLLLFTMYAALVPLLPDGTGETRAGSPYLYQLPDWYVVPWGIPVEINWSQTSNVASGLEVVICLDPACDQQGAVLANGSGTSGSVMFRAAPGTLYGALLRCPPATPCQAVVSTTTHYDGLQLLLFFLPGASSMVVFAAAFVRWHRGEGLTRI